ADERHAGTVREPLGGRDRDTHAGERAGAASAGHSVQVTGHKSRRSEQPLGPEAHHGVGGARRAKGGGGHHPSRRLEAAEGKRHVYGGRVECEKRPHSAIPSAAQATCHAPASTSERGPAGSTSNLRRPSGARWIVTARCSGGSAAGKRSPHSI